jgi:hypothetical protein
MKKLDRLGWAAGITFISHGARVGVRVNDAEVLGAVAGRLPFGWKHARSPRADLICSVIKGGAQAGANVRRFHLVYLDNVLVARTALFDDALDMLESALRLYVAEFATREVFVHAGAVGWRGRAILIPGMSRAGKSTLVAELVRAGAEYYSDELAVLDGRGRVHPYPLPLQLRASQAAAERRVTAVELGGHVGLRPLRVGLVLATEYRDGARWRPHNISAGRCVLALMAHAVTARRRPEHTLATLHAAVCGADALKGVRGEAREVVDALRKLFGEACG